MKNHEEAFTDSPPEGFNVFNSKTLAFIQRFARKAKVDLDDIVSLVGCYSLVSKGESSASEEEITAEVAVMDDQVFDDVVSYINRVNERAESSRVESEDLGK